MSWNSHKSCLKLISVYIMETVSACLNSGFKTLHFVRVQSVNTSCNFLLKALHYVRSMILGNAKKSLKRLSI